MISKENFTHIMEALDEFWNDKADALKILGIQECYFTDFCDKILSAIDKEIDPYSKAREDKDEAVADCGSYLCEWLFGVEGFRDNYPTPALLYDYILSQYNN